MQHAAVLSPAIVLASDSTFFRLVSDAGLFAKFILLLLLAISVISWGVAFDKWTLYRRLERLARGLSHDVARMRSVHELRELSGAAAGPLAEMLREAQRAVQRLQRGQGAPSSDSTREVVVRDFLRGSEKAALEVLGVLEKNLVVLSTATTVSPFLGLLGTCWGIMIAFVNIGAAGSASLDVVAPGIAEALIATIAGLGTAIPALVFYNMLTSRLHHIEGDLQRFAITVSELLSQDPAKERVVS